MKRLFIAVTFLLLLNLPICAQRNTISVFYGSGAPTTCYLGTIYINSLNGNIYSYKIGTGCILAGNTAGSTISGSGVNNRVTFWNGGSSLSSDSGFTVSGTGATFDLTLGRDLIAGRQLIGQFGTITPLSDLPTFTLRRFSNTQTNNIFQVQTQANAHLFAITKDGYLKFPDNSIQQTAATSGITGTLTPGAVPVATGVGTLGDSNNITNPSNGTVYINGGGTSAGGGAFGSTGYVVLSGDANSRMTLGDVSVGYSFIGGNDIGLLINNTGLTAQISGGTESLTIDGTAHTISTTAASGITLDNQGVGNVNVGDANDTGHKAKLVITPNGFDFYQNASGSPTTITATATASRTVILPDASGTVLLDSTVLLGTVLAVDMSNGVLSTATGTVYASPGTTAGLTNSTEGSVSFPITRAGTIRNLYVRTGGTAKVNTPTTVITIRKNGVDTSVTLNLTQTINTTTSDTTHSFTVVAGDLITVSFVTTGTAAVSTSIAGVSFELD